MKSKRMGSWPAAAIAAGIACLAGCRSAPTRYIHPNADIGAIKRVAVLPFENLTQDRSAAEKVQHIFLTEVLSLGTFEVAEPGEVTRVVRAEHAESPEVLTPADLKRMGEALKVDGIFIGTLATYEERTSGATPAPEVTIQVRLIEAQSGVTIWSMSQTRSGATASAKLFGIGGETLIEAARRLIHSELKTFRK